ncbi:MAG: hypothetical protein RLZZ537_189 [Pseudomonadota bacterium]
MDAAPEPLRRPLPPAEPYPIDALGGVLGSAAERIYEVVQAPPELCGQAVLAAASLATQSHADVEMDGRIEPLSLWCITIAESGERKSGVYDQALKAHADYQRELVSRHSDESKAYRLEMMAYEASCKQFMATKKSAATRESIYRGLSDQGEEPKAPLLPVILMQEPTLEGVHKLMEKGNPSIGLFSDDGAEFLGGHAMSKDNRAKSSAGFSKLWDRGEFSRVRAGDGAGQFYGKRMALHLMIQPIIAETALSDEVLSKQGFLARCLLAYPVSRIGQRQYRPVDLSSDPAMRQYWGRMAELLRTPPMLATNTRNELAPRRLCLDKDARRAWIGLHDAIESAAPTDYVNVKAWASKAAAQALRIAGVLTLVENPSAANIGADAVMRAGRLVDYYMSEAARLAGVAMIPPDVKNAELLHKWAIDRGKTYFHSREVINGGPNPLRTKDIFDRAVSQLSRAGWVSTIDGGMMLDGAHRNRVWQVRAAG